MNVQLGDLLLVMSPSDDRYILGMIVTKSISKKNNYYGVNVYNGQRLIDLKQVKQSQIEAWRERFLEEYGYLYESSNR